MFSLVDHIRFRIAKLLYDIFSFVMVRDASWQQSLYESIGQAAKKRILSVGPGSASAAAALAAKFPEAEIVGADPSPQAVKRARRVIARRKLSNLTVVNAPEQCGRLPFNAGTFDKIVVVLTLHDRPPNEKIALGKELLRILRRGGTLHVADYDKPVNDRERRILMFSERISGQAAVEPHLSGSWTTFLTTAGFIGIRRQSSVSVEIGRIAIVKARKH
jgi:ubiquinone/menaquinone biosynthesis C-methylase UbiE